MLVYQVALEQNTVHCVSLRTNSRLTFCHVLWLVHAEQFLMSECLYLQHRLHVTCFEH